MDEFNLEDVRIAAPCRASWKKMKGDDRVRNCAQCSLNVYNLSEMTREEAAELIANTEGRLCIRLWRRKDGTVITKDCPVGFRKIRYGFAVFSTFVVSTLVMVVPWTGLFSRREFEVTEKGHYLEAGMTAKGRIIYVSRNLAAGHVMTSDDFYFAEVEQSKIPMDAAFDESQVIGKKLKYDIANHSILSKSDLSPFPVAIFSGELQGFDLNLNAAEILKVDDLAKKRKTSVSNLMRKWIKEMLKK